MKHNLEVYLSFYDITLLSHKTALPGRKVINVYKKIEYIQNLVGSLEFDERSNIIRILSDKNQVLDEIITKFNEMKKTDVCYGNIGCGDDFDYDGTKTLKVEDFFDYLKIENRELTINKLTN